MTPQQEKKIRTKITRIKANLAADKKRWGGFYHDGNGNRYAPPQLYIQLGDFDGGLRYMNWFAKNFPDDSCYPEFNFEWTLILFMKQKKKEASKKAFETFCSNIYLFDKYFGKELKEIIKSDYPTPDSLDYLQYFEYSHLQSKFSSFDIWLSELINSEKFKSLSSEFISLKSKLKIERDLEKRRLIIERSDQLIEEI